MNKRIILFILFLSAICLTNAKSILAEEGADEDDSTSPVDDTKTTPTVTNTPSVTVPEVTTPKATTIPPTTQAPTAPPVNDPPTLPVNPDDIIEVPTEAPTNSPSEDVADKVVIKTPPITITEETTNDFVNSIPKKDSDESTATPPPPTIPPVEETPKKTSTPNTQLDKLENGKIYGVSIDEIKDKQPTISSTSYGEEDKKTEIYVESKDEKSIQIIKTITASVVQNLVIHMNFNKKNEQEASPRILENDNKVITVTGCGMMGDIVDSYISNILLIFDQNLVFECKDGVAGILANKIINSTISNVRIEFFDDKNPKHVFVYPGQAFGLLAGEVSGSHIFMTRITGDNLFIWPKNENNQVASPFIGRSEMTLIETCYVDLKELTLNFNDMHDSTTSVVIGGLVGEYIISEKAIIVRPTTPTTTTTTATEKDAQNPRMIEEDDSTFVEVPTFNETSNEIYRSFVLIRSSFSVPKLNSDTKKAGKIDFGGLIGKVTIKKDNTESSILFINNCYYSMVANGIVNPLEGDSNVIRFGGLIAEKNEETARRRRAEAAAEGGEGGEISEKTFKLQLNMSYVNYNVKTNYMDIENFGIFYGGEGQFDKVSSLLNNYGYVSLPFASNDSGVLNYHYLTLCSSNTTKIEQRMRLLEQNNFVDVVTFGYGVDGLKEKSFESNSDKAQQILTSVGRYTINPYTKKLMNICPSPTSGGFYESEYSGLNLSPESRGTSKSVIRYKKLKSTNKMNSKMTCPNNCNRNGACYYGKCYCNNYYTGVDCSEHFCPFGVPLTASSSDDFEIPAAECSNQGKCDKTTGKCNCFPGFEGIACQRTRCPNQCSNHGICTTLSEVNRIDIGTSDENDEYVIDYEKKLNNYRDNIINVCVCDKEYYGDDCSKRKCPYGYTQESDCEANNVDGIKFTFSEDLPDSASTSAGTLIYLKYIDPFKRVWYSTAFEYDNVEEWRQALGTLPTGVISISSVDITYTDDSKKEGEFTIDISYSLWQTGRQPAIEVIGKNELLAMGVPTDGSYYGLKDEDLLVIVPDNPTPSANQVTLTVEVGESLKATPCSNNGICNESTGICKCFEMFYGNACELQSEVI